MNVKVRRKRRMGAAVLAAVGTMLMQGDARADDKRGLVERLRAADTESSLETNDLKPWHLKLAVQLYDNKGMPTQEGTIEEWWRGAEGKRISYVLPKLNVTEVQKPAGRFRSKGGESVPVPLEVLLQQVVHPMPDQAEIDEATPYFQRKDAGKVPLDCIMLAQPLSGIPFPPLGLFPTYCFDSGKDVLRLTYDFGSQIILRNTIGRFQGKLVATDVVVQEGAFRSASVKVVTLESEPSLPSNLEDVAELVAIAPKAVSVPGDVIAGSILEKVSPTYPEAAKRRHVSGTVQLHAIIGRDGRVHSLRFLTVPDAELAMAAVAAVRQWRYKPYLLNGEPTEVDTTIAVHFNFGPA